MKFYISGKISGLTQEEAFAKFEMSRCVRAYIRLYEDCAKTLVK